MASKGNRDFRPKYHYAPPVGWINDPNGLLYENGTWHLFAQHYPNDTVWGPMHWRHATSEDLLHWQDRGVALYPDEKLGFIFSGSAVIDRGNTSGLGKDCDPMILMYTSHGEHEQQSIAFSDDRINFTPYAGNPVIPNTALKDFRDPNVFRNEIKNCWTVIIAAGDHVEFHSSENLIDWHKTGEFGAKENKLGGVFECPEMLKLKAPDGSDIYALIASMALPREFGGSRTQYFLGTFDGDTFTQTTAAGEALLLDSGFDNYAAVGFKYAAEPIILGWGTSWNYAADEPTNEFCGMMTYARKCSIVNTDCGLRLATLPITPEFSMAEAKIVPPPQTRFPMAPKQTAAINGEVFHVHVEAEGQFMVSLRNDAGEELRFGFDNERNYFVDRTAAGRDDFNAYFRSGLMSVVKTQRLVSGPIQLDMYFDKALAEVFADGGIYASSTLAFPNAPYTVAEMTGKGKMTVGCDKA